MREITYAAAGIEAVSEEMRVDPKIFYMSTDTIAPLLKEFGPKRIKATPIAEGVARFVDWFRAYRGLSAPEATTDR